MNLEITSTEQDTAGNVTFNGTCDDGATVTVTEGGDEIASVNDSDDGTVDGNWSTTIHFDPGMHKLVFSSNEREVPITVTV